MPANSPLAREGTTASRLVHLCVGPALAARPTGPAAIDASVPRVTLFESSSLDAAPIHHHDNQISRLRADSEAALPFASCMKTGALHLFFVLQLMTPELELRRR